MSGFHVLILYLGLLIMATVASSNVSNHSADRLKEELHLEFLRHLDLCMIFILILRNELVVYDSKSVDTLKSLLSRGYVYVSALGGEDSYADVGHAAELVKQDALLMRWDAVTQHVTRSLRESFGYLEGTDTVSECKRWKLTQSDYDYCSSCIKRDAVGLRCILRRCACISKIEAQAKLENSGCGVYCSRDSAKHASEGRDQPLDSCHDRGKLPSFLNSQEIDARNDSCAVDNEDSSSSTRSFSPWVPTSVVSNRQISGCGRCTSQPGTARLVAMVSPFLYKEPKSPSKDIRGAANCSTSEKDGASEHSKWERNTELYASHTFPLESILGLVSRNDDGTNRDEAVSASSNVVHRTVELVKELFATEAVAEKKKADGVVMAIFNFLETAKTRDDRNMGELPDSEEDQVERKLESCKIADVGNPFREERSEKIHTAAFARRVETKVMEEHVDTIRKVNQLTPFPTIYWLTDPKLVFHVSTLESEGEIKKMQDVVDTHVRNYEREGSLEAKKFLEKIITDNLAYICRRLELVHPAILRLLYTLVVNSNFFWRFYDSKEPCNGGIYINLSNDPSRGAADCSRATDPELAKAMSIMNTIRSCGIGGNKGFVHLKCLHTNLAFALAEGSTIGSAVFSSLRERELQSR